MTTYTEAPENFDEFEPFVITGTEEIKDVFFGSKGVFFYDACSFQRHSGLGERERGILTGYFKKRGVSVFLTRCVLMELASDRHSLNNRYIQFLTELNDAGANVVIFDEEHTYDILSECFSTNERINEYLMWAVRAANSPVSTIRSALDADEKLRREVTAGDRPKASDLYRRFFSAVRGKKEQGDDLGEELIGVCVNILSYLPGLPDGKLCVLTDDKQGAAAINKIMKATNEHVKGARPLIFSTPKLVQSMFRENVEMSDEEMVSIISQGRPGDVSVMGMTAFDLEVRSKITMSGAALVKLMKEPNGINIVF